MKTKTASTKKTAPKAKVSPTIVKRSVVEKNNGPSTTAKAATTTIEARINVGFGNQLFIRGEGVDGLNWEQGVPMTCVAADTWRWTTDRAKRQVRFKVLLNDAFWSQGENVCVAAGQRIEVTPTF